MRGAPGSWSVHLGLEAGSRNCKKVKTVYLVAANLLTQVMRTLDKVFATTRSEGKPFPTEFPASNMR